MISRGAFIVFEGCDRTGKTTQCNKLIARLIDNGIKSQLMKFPDRTTAIGQMINSYLGNKTEVEDHAIHLLFSANRWESVRKIEKLLQNGTTLIVDRYAFSGVAFTAAKKDFDIDWCKQADIGLPQPDAVIYLNLSSDAAAARQSFGEERYETSDFQKKVAKNFDILYDPTFWTKIDADKSIDDLQSEIHKLVKNVVKEVGNNPLKKLWQEK